MLVTLYVERETVISLNYQHALTGVVYATLEQSDPDYARFLHHEGYVGPEDEPGLGSCAGEGAAASEGALRGGGRAPRRFKGFVFSGLFPQHSDSRDARRGLLRLLPGEMRWQIASPLAQFLRAFASGLLQSGEMRVGQACFSVASVETLPDPEFTSPMRGRCLSPVVSSVSVPGRDAPKYLRPHDAEMSERLRQNLVGKHRALFGSAPQDDRLTVEWDAKYLESRKHEKHPGTKLIAYKDIRIVGVVCPFTMTGSTELMRTAYEAGLGEKNAAGFGMIEVAR
jgi:CRISPR-associated endoribonuclease Cas6